MTPGILRLKLALLEYGRPLAIGLAVLGVLAIGWAGLVVSQPPTETISEEVEVLSVSSSVNSSATVTGNSSLWRQGEVLENRPFYPSSAPVLQLEWTTILEPRKSAAIEQSISLVYQAVRDDTIIYERETSLIHEETQVSDGRISGTTSLDTRTVRREVAEINDELTGVGSARVLLRLNLSYDTDDQAGTLNEDVPVRLAASGYWMAGSLDYDQTHTTIETREVSVSPDPMSYLIPAAVGLGALGVAGLVIGFSVRGPEPRRIRDQLERTRYSEWISSGYLDGDLGERRVRTRTLGDLVDIGIDSDKRTIHDADRGLYGVIDGDVLYYYPTADSILQPVGPDEGWEWPFDDEPIEDLEDDSPVDSTELDRP